MPKEATGTIEPRLLADGTRVFHLRVRINGSREPIGLHERRAGPAGRGGRPGPTQGSNRAGSWRGCERESGSAQRRH